MIMIKSEYDYNVSFMRRLRIIIKKKIIPFRCYRQNEVKGMKVGICACSNGHLPEWQSQIKELEKALNNEGIETFFHLIL